MHKIAVATMHNYSTHVLMSVNHVECPCVAVPRVE